MFPAVTDKLMTSLQHVFTFLRWDAYTDEKQIYQATCHLPYFITRKPS